MLSFPTRLNELRHLKFDIVDFFVCVFFISFLICALNARKIFFGTF